MRRPLRRAGHGRQAATLHGQRPDDEPAGESEIGATEASDCFNPTPTEADLTQQAIVDPAGDGFSIAFMLSASGIAVEGFAIEGASVGIDASDRFSGYRMHHNLIQRNALFGSDFGSDGTRPSRVDHNRLRDNDIGGVVSELDDENLDIFDPANRTPANARHLHNARIDHNETFRHLEAITAIGPGPRARVSIDHNRSRADGIGLAIQNSTGSAVVENEVTSPAGDAIRIGAATTGSASKRTGSGAGG